MATFMHNTQCLCNNESIEGKEILQHIRWGRRTIYIRLVLYIEYQEEYKEHQNCFFCSFGGKVIFITLIFGEKMSKFGLFHN